MNILGISCYYHDSAACLIRGGILVAAVQEERFNRKKNSADFPAQAINYCMDAGNIDFCDLDYIVFYEKPYLKFSRVILDHIRAFPLSYKNFIYNIPYWLEDRLVLPLTLKKNNGYAGKTLFIRHHLSHAAAGFLVSPFDEAAIIVADGVGEYATTSYGYGKGNTIEMAGEIHYPDSLGLLYSMLTAYLGFKPNSGEGTTMALASYGTPVYLDKFYEMFEVREDGSFHMNPKYSQFISGSSMYTRHFAKLFGLPRKEGTEYHQKHMDIAASLQLFVEEVLIRIANHTHRHTGSKNLCLAGGVFLNCVANQKILEQTPFENIFIQPGAGDAGGAIGAAFYLNNCLLNNPRKYVMEHAYLGPAFSSDDIRYCIGAAQLNYAEFTNEELTARVAALIHANKIVGWFRGRLEFGPRALGNRSILANATRAEMVSILNDRIKYREWFRPFAPIVPEERACDYFEMAAPSPFMLLAPGVKEHTKILLPAITHIDGTARVQTVSRIHNPCLYQLLLEYEKLSGVPVIINTSFNLKGEPIVCSPEEAIADFQKSEMDCLVLGDFLINKNAHA